MVGENQDDIIDELQYFEKIVCLR